MDATPSIEMDVQAARAFLAACESSQPRVHYGLGAKVPFHGAVPGQDFTAVDCSGFVRELIWRGTDPHVNFKDGSVVQHDWVKQQGFPKVTIGDGMQNDGVVRIAFLDPHDAVPSGVGHVVLIEGGTTMESHGGLGPDSRPWTGRDWQEKTTVYILNSGEA